MESTDGRTLFYLKSEEGPLFARLINAGEERQILEYVTYRAFTVVEEGIYFIGRRGPDNLFPVQFYEFATGKSRLLFKTQGPIQQGLSVSKDRKTILFSRSADAGSDLMLVDHFR